jgi:hypothetical protein
MRERLAKPRALWDRFWYAPIDAAPLALFRQAFGWTLLIYAIAWSRSAPEWATNAGYHPPLILDPEYGPQLPLLPAAALPFVGAVFFAGLLAYIFGFARRVVVWVPIAAVSYSLFVDPISAFTINRLFVIGLIVLAIAPEPDPDTQQQVAWPTRMLQLTVVAQYFGSGLCKTIHGDWWGGEDVLFVQVQGIYMTDAAAWLVRTLPHWTWRVQQELALWFELLAPLLFAVKRLRPLTFVLGLGLHFVVAVTMDQLIYFSLQMACFYLLFIPPEWARWLTPGRGANAKPTSSRTS